MGVAAPIVGIRQQLLENLLVLVGAHSHLLFQKLDFSGHAFRKVCNQSLRLKVRHRYVQAGQHLHRQTGKGGALRSGAKRLAICWQVEDRRKISAKRPVGIGTENKNVVRRIGALGRSANGGGHRNPPTTDHDVALM